MRGLLGLSDFRLLFAGLVTSMIGDSLLVLVFGIWVKHLTGSSGAAGTVIFFVALPFLVAPFGGWVIDRFRRRAFLITANLASAAGLLPLLLVRGRQDVWLIYAIAFLYGLSSVAITGALNGMLKELLPPELLAGANGALQTVKEGLRLGGPLAGAAVFALLGGAAVAVADAATFVVAAVAIASMRIREAAPERVEAHWLQEMTAGVHYLRREAALRRVAVGGAVSMLVSGVTESVAFALIDQGLHRPPEFIGVISSAQGAGAILGGLTVARLIARRGELAAVSVGIGLFGVGVGVCAVTALPVVLAGMAVAGSGLPVVLVGISTLLQRRTPARLAGRVSIALEMILNGPQTISIAAGALLVSVVDYRLLLGLVTAGMLSSSGYLWLGRRLSAPEPPRPPERPPPPAPLRPAGRRRPR